MDDEGMLRLARELAATLEPGDLDATLQQITNAAVRLLPNVQFSSITIFAKDQLKTVAPTDDRLLHVDAEQYRLHEGPCFEAATHDDQVVSSDLRADPRFPRYGAVAVEAGIRSQVGVRLFDTPTSNGALNLYSTRVGAFDDLSSLRALFVHQVGQAIGYAHEVTGLAEAVKSRTLIGQAVGLVMERFSLDEERAFAFLQRLSSHENRKLRVIAEELVAEANRRPDDG